jgi:rSAM/selenodomain-associated transferase 1
MTAEQASELYRALVEDLLERLDGLRKVALYLFFTPEEAEPTLREWLGGERELRPQRGGDLGARMDAAFRSAFQQGHELVVLAGSDVPDLDPETIDRAFQALDGRDVVVGPATDGGYYLIGLHGPQTELFLGIDWGTERVLRQTIQMSSTLGLSIEQLQPLEDMDTHADAYRLWRDLRSQASRRASSPRTEAILQRIFDRSESPQRGLGS